MNIMYVGKDEFVDVPVLPGDPPVGRVARLQGADVPDVLAFELLKTKDWERASREFHPEPPATKDEAALRAAGFDPERIAAAKQAVKDYDPQRSTAVAEADPANHTVPPGNPTGIGEAAGAGNPSTVAKGEDATS